MFKVIIIDDDMIVRVGIKMIVKWEKYNMEVVGEASDGKQGLELYHMYHPDLIITDIRMPGMDGMELLKTIRQYDKEVRFILLTNYDDKKYLKEALRYGANDFIVKNELNDEIMENLLGNEQKQLEKNKRDNQENYVDFESRKRIIQFFMESVSKRVDYEKEFLEKFMIHEDGVFSAAIIQVTHKKENMNSVSEETERIAKLKQIISGTLTNYPLSFIWEIKWKTLSIFVLDNTGILESEQMKEVCQSISNAVRLYTRTKIHICTSGIIHTVDDLYSLKHQVDKSVLASTFFKGHAVIMYEDIEKQEWNKSCSSVQKKMLKQMYMYGINQIDDVRTISHRIMKEASKEKNMTLKWMFFGEFTAWYRRMIDLMDETAKKNARWIDNNMFLSTFDEDEFYEMINFVIDKMEDMCKNLQMTDNETINEILYFINKNYASQISLSDVAEYVHLSKNYISTLFNNVMKESFVDYLTKLRIEKAKEILRMTDCKVSEVAELVGFSSEKYFSVSFKNNVGLSPKEYRQFKT